MAQNSKIPTGPLASEPAFSIGLAISVIVGATFGILAAFGVDVPDGVADNVTLIITTLIAIPAVSGLLIRFFVVAPDTAATAIDRAKNEPPTTFAKPAIVVPGISGEIKTTNVDQSAIQKP